MRQSVLRNRVLVKYLFVLMISAACLPRVHAQQQPTVSPEHKAVIDRLQSIAQIPAPEWRIHAGDIPDGQSARVDDSAWQVVKTGYVWTSGTIWLRAAVQIPAASPGYDYTGASLRLTFATQSDMDIPAIVYLNGSRVAMGVELEPIELSNDVRPGQKILLAVKVICPLLKEVTFAGATLGVTPAHGRPDPAMVAQALQADEALEVLFPMAEIGLDRADANATVESAYKSIDFSALDRGDQHAFDASLDAATQKLAALDPVLKKFTVRAVGNSHIDMAWLWPWSETTMVVHDTFTTALQLMNEYPDYLYAHSSAQTYAWMEEKYPDIFDEIKKRVAEGRWEIVGGMWVEPDLNMPDGESQVRQLLLGKRYFKEKFGKDVRIGWNPDSFGYNWQLPQIYKKSGIDYFVTQKIAWNDTTQFPYKLFWWQSPDGSKVLTYFPHDYVNTMDPVKIARDTADLMPRVPSLDTIMHLYGIGDHGGGPTRFMLDEGKKWMNPAQPFPKVIFSTAQGFFDDIDKEMPRLNLPTWNSELYLQYHRGVFTSQSETKRHNRQSEELLLNAEKFASLAYLTGAEYPSDQLTYAWKKVLFNQFHDVAAGSGISAIYRDADRDYAEVRHIGEESLENSLKAISNYVDTSGPGAAVMIVNPLAWERTEQVEVTVKMPGSLNGINVVDSQGHSALWSSDIHNNGSDEHTVRFLARNIPSFGYEVYRIIPAKNGDMPPSHVRGTDTTVENEFLKLRIDPKTGCITSLIVKRDDFETLTAGTCGNLLQAFQDKPKDYDAWNIDADFEKVHWDILEAQEVRPIIDGPLCPGFTVTKKFQNSTINQVIRLCEGMQRVDIVNDVDWHEKHILLKAGFTLAAQSKDATYEIPFGSIQRPTTRNTKEEQAMYEVPAIRWADISDSAHGFSLLNDSKYGYDAKDNVLRISLLRSPESPDPHADEGRHQFTYSLYPHGGDWKQALTIRQGYELNYPLIINQVLVHSAAPQNPFAGAKGSIGSRQSFISISAPNVILTALKKSEDNEGLILRVYEWAGKGSNITINPSFAVGRVFYTDLMEKELPSVIFVGGSSIEIHLKPFEIQTIKLIVPDKMLIMGSQREQPVK
jgi:alpha-mannosidase